MRKKGRNVIRRHKFRIEQRKVPIFSKRIPLLLETKPFRPPDRIIRPFLWHRDPPIIPTKIKTYFIPPTNVDRRNFNIYKNAIFLKSGQSSGIKVHNTLGADVPWRLTFKNPRKTLICIRRKKRREILFAVGGAGKGKKPNPVRKYNDDSSIICWRR